MKKNKLSKLLIAGITCTVAMTPATDGFAGSLASSTADTASPEQACKGKNSCKGKGGCKTDTHACKGKNSCKGQGGCKTRPMDDSMLAQKRAELL